MNFIRVFCRKLHNKSLAPNGQTQMKVEVISRHSIKPSSPTPNHLRNLKLSLLDQLGPTIFGPMVFFYSFNGKHSSNQYVTAAEQSQKLKRSLSETLTHYYPFAGRLNGNTSVSCDDSGADYMEAEVNTPLSSFLDEPYIEGLQQLIPVQVDSKEATRKMLLAQASFFECGGMALGVCLSHKIADATSLRMFMRGWATMALGTMKTVGFPVFNGASVFPPGNFSNEAPAPVVEPEISKSTSSKRFVFDAASIQALQAKSSSIEVNQPTRVEVVTALIWKCAMKATRTAFRTPKPSVLAQSINIRKRVFPPLHENSIGNYGNYFAARAGEKNQTKLKTLVSELRKAKERFCSDHAKKLVGNDKATEVILEHQKEAGIMLASGNYDFYIFSSLCRFGLYETDFGWGKPTWVSVPVVQQKNIVGLLDTKEGDGIEAWVTLNEEEMRLFEQDKELLAFASLNPGVIEPFVYVF